MALEELGDCEDAVVEKEGLMDRTVWVSGIVFVALAVVGIWFAVSPMTIVSNASDADALRVIGAAMFAAGLTAFLVETLHWDYHHRHVGT